MPDVCLLFVLLFTIFIIVVTQKLVLQQSKNVSAKCTENLSPPPCILYSLFVCMYYIFMSAIAGQTDGPNELKFIEGILDFHGGNKGHFF